MTSLIIQLNPLPHFVFQCFSLWSFIVHFPLLPLVSDCRRLYLSLLSLLLSISYLCQLLIKANCLSHYTWAHLSRCFSKEEYLHAEQQSEGYKKCLSSLFLWIYDNYGILMLKWSQIGNNRMNGQAIFIFPWWILIKNFIWNIKSSIFFHLQHCKKWR